MTSVLLTTKFFPPPPREQMVPRPRLVERLEAGLRQRRKLTLISAPAGFGKTTLVVEACQRLEDCQMAWLSLDEADNDPLRFWRYAVTALRRADSQVGEMALEMLELAAAPQAVAEPQSVLVQIESALTSLL